MPPVLIQQQQWKLLLILLEDMEFIQTTVFMSSLSVLYARIWCIHQFTRFVLHAYSYSGSSIKICFCSRILFFNLFFIVFPITEFFLITSLCEGYIRAFVCLYEASDYICMLGWKWWWSSGYGAVSS